MSKTNPGPPGAEKAHGLVPRAAYRVWSSIRGKSWKKEEEQQTDTPAQSRAEAKVAMWGDSGEKTKPVAGI
jgi:hypothetical protein